MKSIICNDKCCYLCGGTENLEEHHCLHGTANRKLADKYGLTVMLCEKHHRRSPEGVHGGNTVVDLLLKRIAQLCFEMRHSHEKWMQVFGRNYL